MERKTMRITNILSAAALFWAIGSLAQAQDILSKAVNNPAVAWSVFGDSIKSELIKDGTVSGGVAERVTVRAKGEHPWDGGAYSLAVKPIATGDVLLLAFWARAQEVPASADGIDINARLQENAAPYPAIGSDTPIHIGTSWKLYYAHGIAAKDYAPNAVAASLQLATAQQVIDFGPIFLLDFGPKADPGQLPRN